METSFEEITRKYRLTKAGKTRIDLLCLKSEIESYIKNQQSTERKDDDLAAEAQGMLMDVTQVIEEDQCNPFRPEKLQSYFCLRLKP
jgi:predicted NACHT family NTPase